MGRISGGSFWMATPTADAANCSGEFEHRLSPSMRRDPCRRRQGFVDFAQRSQSSMRRPAWCARGGDLVSALGASNFTYGGVTYAGLVLGVVRSHLLVPDNLKSGVHRASFYDPGGQSQLRRHGGTLRCRHSPARPYHPKDKAKLKLEYASLTSACWADCATCSSLAECNAAITEILVQLNGRVMRRLGQPAELFETIERPVTRPPPDTDHEYEWAFARVGIDYQMIEVAAGSSTPSRTPFRSANRLSIRLTERTVKTTSACCRHTPGAMAAHGRWHLADHMPSAHRLFRNGTPSASRARLARSVPTPRR